MSTITSLLFASAFAATGQGDATPDGAGPASLSFSAKDRVLIGTVYGISAVDDEPRLYGQRLAADVPAGRRTVSYECPGRQLGIDGSRLTYDFAAGSRYLLVCHADREAEILLADDC